MGEEFFVFVLVSMKEDVNIYHFLYLLVHRNRRSIFWRHNPILWQFWWRRLRSWKICGGVIRRNLPNVCYELPIVG